MPVKKLFCVLFILLCVLFGGNIHAQEFGFGFDDTDEPSVNPPLTAKLGGEIRTQFIGYVHDFESAEELKVASLGDIFLGKVNVRASGANVDAFMGINLSAKSLKDLSQIKNHSSADTPLILDETYLRVFFGPVNVEAGYRKLFWGKADSLGPLDVINPLDYSDLTDITDIMTMKIARPLLHVTWSTSGFSKLEAVFTPHFSGDRFDQEGRWMPSQFSDIPEIIKRELNSRAPGKLGLANSFFLLTHADTLETTLMEYFNSTPITVPETAGLEYFETGLRYTTSLGGIDLGAQYYYGYLPRPSWYLDDSINAFLDDLNKKIDVSDPNSLKNIDPQLLYPYINFDRYHLIGIDYAQVLWGFNLRTELAAYLTKDFSGDNGAVKNPFIGWSLGFDRDLVWGINANIQCNETIRLLNSKIGNNKSQDFEAGTEPTSTRLTMVLSKKFLKDNLESKVTAIWDIENSDCYVIPAVIWTIKDIKAEICGGIFAGKKSGELGQYEKNSFVKLGLNYTF